MAEIPDLRIDEYTYRSGEAPQLDVMDEVFGYVWAGTADELPVEERVRRFGQLTPGQQVIMPTNSLHGEMLNGGFAQYFYNSGSLFCHEALAGLKALGATQHAELLDRLEHVSQSAQLLQDGLYAAGGGPAFEAIVNE